MDRHNEQWEYKPAASKSFGLKRNATTNLFSVDFDELAFEPRPREFVTDIRFNSQLTSNYQERTMDRHNEQWEYKPAASKSFGLKHNATNLFIPRTIKENSKRPIVASKTDPTLCENRRTSKMSISRSAHKGRAYSSYNMFQDLRARAH